MPLPMIGTSFVSRYPDLRAVASVATMDPPEPHSRPLPTLGDRIRAAMRSYGRPVSASEIADRIGSTSENVCGWLKRPQSVRVVRSVGKERQRHRGKAANLWQLAQ